MGIHVCHCHVIQCRPFRTPGNTGWAAGCFAGGPAAGLIVVIVGGLGVVGVVHFHSPDRPCSAMSVTVPVNTSIGASKARQSSAAQSGHTNTSFATSVPTTPSTTCLQAT